MHDGGLEPSAVEPYVTAHSGIRVVTVHESVIPASSAARLTSDLWVTLLATYSLYLHTDSHPTRRPYRLYALRRTTAVAPLQHHSASHSRPHQPGRGRGRAGRRGAGEGRQAAQRAEAPAGGDASPARGE
jgi:hypothetical protein